MKGVQVESVGAEFKVVDGLEVPEPSENQILVKSIAAAINPVDTYLQATGVLVTTFPIVLGCDAGGVVVKVGSAASSLFQIGDRVCGCTRLGTPGYSTYQEYFLMDAPLTLPIPKGLSIQQGATLGVGTYTAALGLFPGLNIEVPKPNSASTPRDEWVVILGGAGSVGQYSVQIAKALGYKVVATCSKSTAGLVQDIGADAVIDYSKSEDDQLKELKEITGGNFRAIYDTVTKSEPFSRKALTNVSTAKDGKVFITTDDWSPMKEYDDHKSWRIELGPIGREGEALKDAPALNEQIASYIPFLESLLVTGKLRPNGFKVVGKGFEAVPDAIKTQLKGVGGGLKVIVDLQSED